MTDVDAFEAYYKWERQFVLFTNICAYTVSQVVYVKGVEAAPIPGPQGPPGTPVSVHDFAGF